MDLLPVVSNFSAEKGSNNLNNQKLLKITTN